MIRPLILASTLFFASEAIAVPPAPAAEPAAAETAANPAPPAQLHDGHEVRSQLRQLLERHPPEVGRVLKLDPTLWSNQAFLAHYPAIASFAAAHPEVAHSPDFYLESVQTEYRRVESEATLIWERVMEAVSIVAVVTFLTALFTWLIRTIIDHRRWSRLSRVQTEVHNKLLDRFTSNEELLAYIQTPGGKRFLEAAPISVAEGPRAISAPLNRILWSVQIGFVMITAGLGFRFLAATLQKELSAPFAVFGVLGISVGLGFLLSAGASWFIAQRLGLWTGTDDGEKPTTLTETSTTM